MRPIRPPKNLFRETFDQASRKGYRIYIGRALRGNTLGAADFYHHTPGFQQCAEFREDGLIHPQCRIHATHMVDHDRSTRITQLLTNLCYQIGRHVDLQMQSMVGEPRAEIHEYTNPQLRTFADQTGRTNGQRQGSLFRKLTPSLVPCRWNADCPSRLVPSQPNGAAESAKLRALYKEVIEQEDRRKGTHGGADPAVRYGYGRHY